MTARHPGRRVRRTSDFNHRRRISQRARRIITVPTNPPTATVLSRSSHALPLLSAHIRPSLPPVACLPLTPLTPSLRDTLRPFSEVFVYDVEHYIGLKNE